MNVLKTCGENYHQLVPSLSSKCVTANGNFAESLKIAHKNRRKQMVVRGSSGGERRSFLTLEEAGLVEVSGLSTHERFLCRLTVRYGFNLYILTIQLSLRYVVHSSLL